MLIMPSFKKSLIVEQFQGNYLKVNKTTAIILLPKYACLTLVRALRSRAMSTLF